MLNYLSHLVNGEYGHFCHFHTRALSGYILRMNICLFDSAERMESGAVRLGGSDERARHILRVLRKGAGDTFEAGEAGGMAGTATISSVGADGSVEFTFEPKGDGRPLRPLDLLVGFPRPIQLRRLLRDAAGLGARRVVLCGTELGEKSYLDSNVVSDGSAERMLRDGTVQAGSTHVPELRVFASLHEAVGFLSDAAVKIALDNRRAECPLGEMLSRRAADGGIVSAAAAVGSERGWTDRERDALSSAGWTLCSMGERVLRTETAVTVAGAVILNSMGFLG